MHFSAWLELLKAILITDADDDDEPHDTKSAMDKFIREFGPGKYANV